MSSRNEGSFGLGLLSGDWAAFKAHIEELNAQCPEGESVKVIYAARHGQAEHNVIKEKHGVPDEIGQIMYPILDPELTAIGRGQASTLGEALQRESGRGMPLPEKWFVSPLRRTGETCGLEWGWLFGEHDEMSHGVPAIVVENIREHLHVHQCDKRLKRSDLQKIFPSFTYLPATTEEDELWQPGSVRGRETEEELVARRGVGINECLEMSEGVTYISVTSHSGALRGIYASLHAPPRSLNVGEMDVLIVRVKKVGDDLICRVI
ncbi:hypothetical protein IAT38_007472 [Cryptococcus sp. DSM 104549]